jgi:hypothetical protein
MAENEYTHEVWKPIPFAPDYAASSYGRIRRETPGRSRLASMAIPGRILRPGPQGEWNGSRRRYLGVQIVFNGKARKCSVHKAVAWAFHGPPPTARHVVAHNDGDGHNNRPENLRWATQAENLADRSVHGTHDRGERNVQSKLTEDDVRAIRLSALPEKVLGLRYGVAATTVGRIRRRERWAWLP